MKFYIIITSVILFSFLFNQDRENKPGSLKLKKNKIKINNNEYNFDFENQTPKKVRKNPELKVLIDKLKNEFLLQKEALKRKHRSEIKDLKKEFKLRRDQIIKEFKKNIK